MDNLANHIADKIKKKISYCLNNNKINLFYNYFNSLVNNLNITSKNLNSFALKELEEYYYQIIDSVFNDNIDKLLEENLKENKIVDRLKFTKSPSSYLYEKIKQI